MSTIYECVECDLRYCVNCDGGQDTCASCHRGPMCEECAADHDADHAQEEREEQKQDE